MGIGSIWEINCHLPLYPLLSHVNANAPTDVVGYIPRGLHDDPKNGSVGDYSGPGYLLTHSSLLPRKPILKKQKVTLCSFLRNVGLLPFCIFFSQL